MRANKKLITHKPPNPCVISEIDVGTRKYIVDPKRLENITFELCNVIETRPNPLE